MVHEVIQKLIFLGGENKKGRTLRSKVDFMLVIPSFELIIIHMKNIRLLWSRFVGEICTVNYRTPLESYGDT